MEKIFLFYVVVINIFAFVTYGVDKLKAKRGKRRIPEAVLLLLAVFGGSVGAWFAIGCWRHKTLHKKFRYGIPMILLLQLMLCCLFLREFIKVYINML